MNTFDEQHGDSSSPDELPAQGHHRPLSHQNVLMLTEDILAAIDADLEQLPPRQTLTVETAIKRLAPRIRKLREDGYTTAEVVAELNKRLGVFDMKVSSRSLTRHLPSKPKTAAKHRSA